MAGYDGYDVNRRHLLLHRICEIKWTEKVIQEDSHSLKITLTMNDTCIELSCHRETQNDIHVKMTGDLHCDWTFKNGTCAADFALKTGLSVLERNMTSCNPLVDCDACGYKSPYQKKKTITTE